jgi:hypothetical protein
VSLIDDLAGDTPAPLESLVETNPVSSSVPLATTRNKAVIASFQTDNPEQAVGNFQTIMGENAVGDTSTMSSISAGVVEANSESDFQGLMDVFADPNASIEQKEEIVRNFQTSPRLKDLSLSLADNALAAESEGMNDEQDFVRVTTAESLGEYFATQKEQQGLINAFRIANQEREGAGRSLDWAEVIAPGTMALSAELFESAFAEASGEQRTIWDSLKATVLPGFSALDFRKKFEGMSDYDKTQFISKFLGVVKENSGLIAGDENQVNALQLLDRYLVGEYDTSDAVIDSLFNVLDLVGLGFTAKGITRGLRGARVAPEVAAVPTPTITPSTVAGATPEAATVAPPMVPRRALEIEELENQHSNILSKVQSRLDPGSVASLREEITAADAALKDLTSTLNEVRKGRTREIQESGATFKEARKIAESEIADRRKELEGRKAAIESRLKINAESETAQSQLLAIENRIAKARKDTGMVPARLNPIADAIHRIELNGIVAIDNPSAAGNILSNMNPAKGRALFKTVFESQTDEIALAAFGVTKQEAIVSSIFPQVATTSGKVRAKVADVQRGVEVPTDEGGIRFTKKEQENMSAAVTRDFRNATGLEVHDAESTFRVDTVGGKFKVSAMYGTSEGGFLKAEDAVQQAKYALRRYGVSDDSIVVMQKRGVDYEPVDLNSVRGVEGDFKIRVDTEIDQNLDMMGDGWEHFDVKRNFFDRFGVSMHTNEGSLTRMLTDAASNVHPAVSGSFAVATDVAVNLEKTLLKQSELFAEGYNKLPKARQEKVWDYLLEANEKGIAHNVPDLIAKGFTGDEINTLQEFRSFWDAHWQLENLDVIRTLKAQNFQLLENTAGDKYFVRPIPKNINHNKVLDPSTDTIRSLSKQEMDDLYDNGGSLGVFKTPIDINGTNVEHVMVRNTPTEYLKELTETDKALNYREGYFQVNYKAPKFIREVHDDGTMKAVAVAGDTARAEFEAKRLTAANGKNYIVTGDERTIRRSSDEYWDVNSTGGRVAQRRRGQPLEGSTGINHIDGATFIENPIDSAIRAARSIAGRTVTRPAIETAKERALQQYGHMLPKDQYGRPVYPDDVKQIKLTGEYTTSELADARTTFENIRRFESGYINSIDEATKAVFNTIANGIGKLSVTTGVNLAKAERVANLAAEGKGVSGLARGIAFQSYIALSPFRNWIMQPAQVIRTVAYNPIDWANGNMMKSMVGVSKYIATGTASPDAMKMYDALIKSGMLDAVDRSNLVRGAMMDAAENSNAVTRGTGKVFEFSRKIGFDIGEKINLMGHYSAVWNKYKRKGANLDDPRVLAEIHSETRAISGEMNKAGDMAYNQNSLSMVFQFAQVPHKFILGTTNRRIDRLTRARMAAGDVILWGVPGTYALSSMFGKDMLPDDPEYRDIVTSGVAAHFTNVALQTLMRDDTGIDLSSLAPYNLGGFADILSAAWEDGGISTIISNSPAGQLLLKDTGRFGAAMNSLMRHFTPLEEGLDSPESIMDTVNQFAKISSGWNNITKGYIAYQTGMALDKNNIPTDISVTGAEAIAMAFGFPTKTTQSHYDTIGKLMDNKKANEQVAKDLVNSVFQMYSSAYSGESALDPEYITRITGALLSLAKKQPQLADAVWKQMQLRLQDPTDSTIGNILRAVDMPNIDMLESIVKDAPIPADQKDNVLQLVKDVKSITDSQKEE